MLFRQKAFGTTSKATANDTEVNYLGYLRRLKFHTSDKDTNCDTRCVSDEHWTGDCIPCQSSSATGRINLFMLVVAV